MERGEKERGGVCTGLVYFGLEQVGTAYFEDLRVGGAQLEVFCLGEVAFGTLADLGGSLDDLA